MITQIFAIIILVLLAAYVFFSKRAMSISSSSFLMTLLGVIVGLSIGALVSLPLSSLGGQFGKWLPIIANVFSVAVVTTFFYNQRERIAKSLGQAVSLVTALVKESRRLNKVAEIDELPSVVIDTSVIIDGRLMELVRTGFMTGKLVVPRFVLNELQMIADSEDGMRRSKGRRGLEILNDLRREPGVVVEISDEEFSSEPDVDSKIIKLAKRHKAKLMTVDYNLNRVAQIQNLTVLNINELNNALRPVVLPGEQMAIKIVQSGKDPNQGVGYLPDGTMIVVEDGDKHIGEDVQIQVTRVFQTVAGKMIFATLLGDKQMSRG